MVTTITTTNRFQTHTNSNGKCIALKQDVHNRVQKLRTKLISRGIHSTQVMATAGFTYTGVGDTVRCNTCSLEISRWTATMIPSDIHAERSPQCEFVRSQLPNRTVEMDITVNPAKRQKIESYSDQYKHNCRLVEVKILKQIRRNTFSHWSSETKSLVEQMITAGFFSCNVGDRVICLYCNLICQQWIVGNDDPLEVHKTISPQCVYVQSILIHPQSSSTLALDDMSSNNQTQQERNTIVQYNETNQTSNSCTSNQHLVSINDPNVLSRYVAARLDLTISQSVLDENFILSVIKRCWEDQLKLKQYDFIDSTSLFIACVILQKQIDHIKGNIENIIIPSTKLKLIREREQSKLLPLPQIPNVDNTVPMETQSAPVITPTIEPSNTKQHTKVSETSSTKNTIATNLCLICSNDEKRLACIPCGHFVACVSCSQTIRICPICRREIEAYVRIFV
ncbi:unnamed protein product [Adineta steineri]|uniref:RING-type domain-containing protein n=1 Tax=Adineta steineri TaxID=433720 RepID=A0A813SK19_9BILA|nr:unnamed protein product [Adineta steineri]CAF0798168.1 unnamed protein product [Adineta steineri]